jgi:hypothetical protein
MLQVTPRHVHRLKSSALACDHFGRSARISLLSLRRSPLYCRQQDTAAKPNSQRKIMN